MFIGEQTRLACLVFKKKSWGSFLLLRMFDYAVFFFSCLLSRFFVLESNEIPTRQALA